MLRDSKNRHRWRQDNVSGRVLAPFLSNSHAVVMRFEVLRPSFEGEPVGRRPILRFRLSPHIWKPSIYTIRHGWFLGLDQGNFRKREPRNSLGRGYVASERDRLTRSVTFRDRAPVVRWPTVKNHAGEPDPAVAGEHAEAGVAQ